MLSAHPSRAGRGSWSTFALLLGLGTLVAVPMVSVAQQADQQALLAQIRERMQATDTKVYVTPLPGSRSVILAIDGSAEMYFFFERGSIRGSAIDEFYAAYDAGDTAAAYAVFRKSALPTIRITDYGWNGLGVPFTTSEGTEINDILFRVVDGVFKRAPEITDEDVSEYVSALQTILQRLPGS